MKLLRTSPGRLVSFDPVTHTFTRDGRIVPSVTQKLVQAGLVTSFYKGTAPRDDGTEIHNLTTFVDINPKIIPKGSNEKVEACVLNYSRLIKELGIKRIESEAIVYSPIYDYAGITDGVWLFQGEEWIGDIKTGSTIPPWAKLQLAAYDIAKGATIIRRPLKRMCLHIRPTWKDCKIKTYIDESDYKKWIDICRP